MKNLLNFILTCLVIWTLPCEAETIQEGEIEHILSVRNIRVSEVDDICVLDTQENEFPTEEGLSCKLLTGLKKSHDDLSILLRSQKPLKKSQKFETYAVIINVIDGYTYHVADYYGSFGNSRVVTCLDGDMRGYQGISDNGVLMVASTDVKWHKDYFEHTYPAGKVYTYKNKQVFDIKIR